MFSHHRKWAIFSFQRVFFFSLPIQLPIKVESVIFKGDFRLLTKAHRSVSDRSVVFGEPFFAQKGHAELGRIATERLCLSTILTASPCVCSCSWQRGRRPFCRPRSHAHFMWSQADLL